MSAFAAGDSPPRRLRAHEPGHSRGRSARCFKGQPRLPSRASTPTAARPETTAMSLQCWVAVPPPAAPPAQPAAPPARCHLAGPRSRRPRRRRPLAGGRHRLLVNQRRASPRSGCTSTPARGGSTACRTEDHQLPAAATWRLIVDFGGWRAVRAATGGAASAPRARPRSAFERQDDPHRDADSRSPSTARRAPPASVSRPGIAPRVRREARLPRRGDDRVADVVRPGRVPRRTGPPTRIARVAVAPGSTLIQGIPNNSMIVEQPNGVVVVEGALSDFRAEALISLHQPHWYPR